MTGKYLRNLFTTALQASIPSLWQTSSSLRPCINQKFVTLLPSPRRATMSCPFHEAAMSQQGAVRCGAVKACLVVTSCGYHHNKYGNERHPCTRFCFLHTGPHQIPVARILGWQFSLASGGYTMHHHGPLQASLSERGLCSPWGLFRSFQAP